MRNVKIAHEPIYRGIVGYFIEILVAGKLIDYKLLESGMYQMVIVLRSNANASRCSTMNQGRRFTVIIEVINVMCHARFKITPHARGGAGERGNGEY